MRKKPRQSISIMANPILPSEATANKYLELIEERDKTEKAFFPGLMQQLTEANEEIKKLHMQILVS